MVLHEEHHRHQSKCKSWSKKGKAKKILSVAQLEKRRIEEQHKSSDGDNTKVAASSSSSSNPSHSLVLPAAAPPQQERPFFTPRDTNPETAVSFSCRVPHFCHMVEFACSMRLSALHVHCCSKEGASSSNSYQADWRSSEVHSNKRIRENGTSADSRGFLTFGSSSTQATSRPKQAVAILPDFSLLQAQGATAKQPAILSENTFYYFLPMAPTTHETEAKEENSEAVNDVTTSLKL